jgi:signal peptidase I
MSVLRSFLLPRLTRGFLVRVVLLASLAYVFFGQICIPFRIRGCSMEPTYHDGGFNFCFRLRYLLSEPRRCDIVLVRLAGKRVMLLKRVVAVAGEEVEFRQGKFFVDGLRVEEPYVAYPCDWELPPRRVKPGHVYVVGDNRSGPIEGHNLGQTSVSRIVGAPLW